MSYFQTLKEHSPLNEAILMPFSGSTCLTFCTIQEGKKQLLKQLRPEFQDNPQYLALFTKEFEVGNRLEHPHLVKYHKLIKQEGNSMCMLMEFIEGETLEARLKQNPHYFKNEENLEKFVSQLLQGLDYLHTNEVLHLDITPSNILLTQVSNNVKIIDLGFCYTGDFNAAIGRTAPYAAPEQMQDSTRVLDARTDLYAVGRLLQEIEIAIGTSLPRRFRQLMQKCLQCNKDMRPNSASECLQLIQPRKRWLWMVGTLLVLLAVGLCLGLSKRSVRDSLGQLLETMQMKDYDMTFRGVNYRILSEKELTCEVVSLETGIDSLFIGTNVNIPTTLEHRGKNYRVISIANLALSRQTELPSIQLPDGLERIGAEVFWNDSSLTTLSIPNTVKEIGPHAFQSCERLENIKLSKNLKEIPYQSFQECRALKQIIIPEGVESIGMDCFINCFRLEEITLPSTLRRIDRGAFYLCRSLQRISLPEHLEEMGDFVFHHCDSLKEVYNYSLTPQLITDIFDRTDITLHVPASSLQQYSSAPVWKELNIVPME